MRARVVALAAVLIAMWPMPAEGIPAFARKYRVSCAMCHAPAPRLTTFGEKFAENGFEFSPREEPRDTIQTGDPLLRLQREVPLAVRIDAYLLALSRRDPSEAAVDQQFPWTMKVLSGGQIADRVSYYTYFLVSERGEVAGLEDAYVQFTNVGGSQLNLLVGQFQVSDPMFKRELRLHYEDYQLYRVRVGEARADLTYDRGIMAAWSPRDGTDLSFQVVNGQGLRAAGAQRQYDTDSFKNFALRASQELGPLRVGGFFYAGAERSEGVRSRIRAYGPDATLAIGSHGELNLQFLRRHDSDPFFGACNVDTPCPGGATAPFSSDVNAAMGELVLWPGGPAGRWFVTGLVNWIDARSPVVSLRLGEQDTPAGYLTRYQTASLGAHYLLRRNLRLLLEPGWDLERRRARVVSGFSAAF
jgi:hypothetical protein